MIKTYTIARERKSSNQKSSQQKLREYGFSLIELLVVMAIVAFVTAGVTLIAGSSSAKYINKQGDNLFAQMQFALDEALMSNTAVGLLIEQDEEDLALSTRYQWLSDKGIDPETRLRTWNNISGYISRGELANNVVWDIVIEDTSLEDALDNFLLEDDAPPQPQIVFFPSGELSDFEITLTLSEDALADDPDAINERYKIAINEYGELARYKVGVEQP